MVKPPLAKKKSHTLEAHGDTRDDPYYWMRDKTNPEVIAYLEEENAYTKAMMADAEDLQTELYEEMKGRIKETDTSAPVKIDDYYYYSRTEEGKQYPIYCRKRDRLDNKEEVLLDHNELAKDHTFLDLGVFEVSPDHQLLAYSINTDGSERYTVCVKDLTTGELLTDVVENTYYSLEWRNDSRSFFYTTLDDAMRPSDVHVHTLGTDSREDTPVFSESDERFFVSVSKSRSKKYIFIESGSKVTTEVYFLDADIADTALKVISPRQQGHEYYVEHHDESFFILTNDQGQNFRLVKTPVTAAGSDDWTEVISHRDEVMLDSFDVFKDYLVLYELVNGLINVRIQHFGDQSEHYVQFSEEVYAVRGVDNPTFDTVTLRLAYSSLVTPESVYDYRMDTKERQLVKQEEVLGGYDSMQYETKRVWATAADGARIPISLAYKKASLQTGRPNPCWLYGYGSYGMVLSPSFSANRISLLDRGFIFAIAHIRGGGEKGRGWYQAGKYLQKENTFSDFIASAEHLITEGYTSKEELMVCGRSAGGLLIGSVLNKRPELFKAAIADVPFVDVMTTMLDPTIPLTVTEYEEWGNPNDKEYYTYMRSYSPYDNVRAGDYPHLLVTAGLNDPRVQYWEPAKWVAKLRTAKTDNNTLLLKTEMEQGHMGASGRYDLLKEIAFEYAFALKILSVTN
jgi:oligopeptidase B